MNVLIDTSVWSLALRRAKRVDERRAFPDIQLDALDYEEAAAAFNRCRGRGIQGSNTDFLICSVALRRDLAVYTTDNDFVRFANVLKFELHEPRV